MDLGTTSQGGKRRGWQSQASASHHRVSESVPEPCLVSPVSILPGLSAAVSHGLSEPSTHWESDDEWASQKTSLISRTRAPGRSHGCCVVGPSSCGNSGSQLSGKKKTKKRLPVNSANGNERSSCRIRTKMKMKVIVPWNRQDSRHSSG